MASFYYDDQNPLRFSFIFKFGNPSEFSTKVLICTRKQNPEGFWSCSKMTSSCKWPNQEPIWAPACYFKIYLRELLFQLVPLPAIDKNISARLWQKVSGKWSVTKFLCASLFLRSTNQHETSFKCIKDGNLAWVPVRVRSSLNKSSPVRNPEGSWSYK